MREESSSRTVETGVVTMNDAGALEAVGSGVSRNVDVFSPYGYSYSLPAGEKMLMAENGASQAGLGVMMNESVKTGEIKIANPFGAYIYLKEDGSVVINGLTVTKNGEVIMNG